MNIQQVMELARWKCQRCGVKTPKKLRGTYEDCAPEIDHIVPIAHGGAHAQFNLQCLCRKCNAEKSATAFGQLSIDFAQVSRAAA